MTAAAAPHIPVLLAEIVTALAPADGAILVDGTFGAGGYSRALLDAADCRVVGIDRDPAAIARGREMAAQRGGRLTVLQGRFGDMESLLAGIGIDQVQGVTLDLGVSSPQLDDPARGFSFRFEGPLDMRMGSDGPSAAEVVNEADEETLADILWQLGEERASRRIARAIVAARKTKPIATTTELADIVRGVLPRNPAGIDPATKSFQALRLHVNDELGELDRGLAAAERLLAPGGRLAVVSFHSLEDRRVKNFLRSRSGHAPAGSRHAPARARGPAPSFNLLESGGVPPSAPEVARNPRARSARLRAAERTGAPPWRADSPGDAR